MFRPLILNLRRSSFASGSLLKIPKITITSGNGYAGSTYSSDTIGGQWFADETAISGATDTTFVMTTPYEGKSITYRTTVISNSFKLFVPSQLSGLVAWFDAADLSTLTKDGSNVVSQWNSKVGTLVAAQATAGNRPTWSATGRNGQPAIVSAAASTQFFNLSSLGDLPSGTATSHIVATAYHTATTSWRGLWYSGNAGSGTNRLIMKNNNNFVGLFTGAAAGDTISGIDWNTKDHIVSGVFTNTANRIIADGNDSGLVTKTGTFSTTNTAGMLLNTYNNQPWDGTLQEILVFNRELTNAERQLVEGYKAAKWNLRYILPATHPYKSNSPMVGRNISITAGTGYAGSTYTAETTLNGQWYIDETPIAGATAKTLTMLPQYEGKSITYRVGSDTSNSIRMFVPTQITGAVAWFDSSDTTTLTVSAGKVSQWASKIGTMSANQSNSNLQPSWSATGRNNLPAIASTGGQLLDLANTDLLSVGTASSQVFATAFSATANNNYRQLWNQGSPSTGNSRILMKLNTNVITATAYGTGFDNSNTLTWLNADRIVSGAWSAGTAIRNNADGQLAMTSRTGLAFNTTNANSRFFATMDNKANEWWEGSLQEFIIFNRELTTTERQLIEGYKAAKWNLRAQLPSDHPYKATIPFIPTIPLITISSGTGYVGSTYSANMSGGQWYANDVAISGATVTTYVMTSDNEGKAIKYRVNDLDSEVIRLFTPAAVPGVIAWFDASATSTLTIASNAVSQWNSRVGTYTATQATAANRPLYSATGRNNLPALLSNGATSLSFTSTTGLPTGTTPSQVMGVAYNTDNSTTYRAVVVFGSRFFGKGDQNTPQFTLGSPTNDNRFNKSWIGVDKIFSMQMTSTASNLYIDGTTTPSSVTTTHNTASSAANIMVGLAASQTWAGALQDFAIFNAILSDSDRQKLEGYLASKWNLRGLLPSDHPYKNSAPNIGSPINIAVTITSGSGYAGSTYTTSMGGGQWYVDDSAMVGETGTNYVMTPANEGRAISYRVGTNTSNSIRMFMPNQLSGLVAWLDASDASTLTISAGKVSRWNSKVGTFALQQTTAAMQPAYSATGRNGKPALVTTGSQYFDFVNKTVLPYGTATGHFITQAYHDPGSSSWEGLIHYGNQVGGARYMSSKNPNNNVTIDNGSGGIDTGVTWLDKDHIVSTKFLTTGSMEIEVDSGNTQSRTATINTDSAGAYAQFFRSFTDQYWRGSCQEWFMYNRALSAAERQQVEGYLATHWDTRGLLPALHPYKTSAPTV